MGHSLTITYVFIHLNTTPRRRIGSLVYAQLISNVSTEIKTEKGLPRASLGPGEENFTDLSKSGTATNLYTKSERLSVAE